MVSCAIAAFFYVRVIVLMFFTDPVDDGPAVAVPSAVHRTALAIGALVTVVLGVVPQPAAGSGQRRGYPVLRAVIS